MAHHSLKLLGMLLIYLLQAGFMCLPLLPLCILYTVVDVISQRTEIALQQQVVSCWISSARFVPKYTKYAPSSC